jgi:acyl dehydratase
MSAQEGIVSEEILEKLRSRIGPKHSLKDTFNELASKEAIRKFVDGIGDPNLLWYDEGYAKKTRYGCLVAPPSWLYSVFVGWITLEIPGLDMMPAGADWEFYRPVLIGDKITVDHAYTDLDVKRGGSLIIENHEELYHNQKGELMAKAKSWSIGMKSLTDQAARAQEAQIPHPWSEEELRKIESEILSEPIRGADIRYWEEVEIDEELPPVIKGPFGLTDMVAYLIGASPVRFTAHGNTLRLLKDHPRLAFRDPETSSPERIEASHFNRVATKAMGMKTGFSIGGQNHCWVIHLLTNWMGDDGWLKRSFIQYRGIVNFSDVVWCRGKVTKKYIDENREHCVDIETSTVNQRGENVAPGNSTVILPSRDKKIWPLVKRLKK